jgi:CheY-like chemotaxis protein
MPRGGALTIATRNVRLDDEYAKTDPEIVPGDYVLIEVSDTGAGMTPETVAHAFEPFFTTKGPGHGTGLGLSMVYGFVKQSGGHAKIYSKPGHGTSVRLYLPRAGAAGATAPAASDVAADEALPRGSETILVVEDNEQMRQTAVAQLASLGYRTIEAANGAAAQAILQQPEPRVHLLFTDLVMPGSPSGAELADVARAQRPGIKVLLTSGFLGETLRSNGNGAPAWKMLAKPYRKDSLAKAVRSALDSPSP